MTKRDRQGPPRPLAFVLPSPSRESSVLSARTSERLNTAEAESSTTDLRKEIAKYVNDAHAHENLAWTDEQVKSKLQYVKQKYKEVKNMSLTGEGVTGPEESDILRARQEKVCPPFERLDAVMSSSFSASPASYRQSTAMLDDKVDASDSEGYLSEIEESEDNDDIISVSTFTVSQANGTKEGPPKKRQRVNNTNEAAAIPASMHEMKETADRQTWSQEKQRRELRQREQVIEQRKWQLIERMLRIEAEARQRLEAELVAKKEQFNKEIADEKALFKKEMAEDKALFKKDMTEEKVAFKKDMAEGKEEIRKERLQLEQKRERYYELLAENRTLKKELEMRAMKVSQT
ncbi:hypothetical protein BGZ54_005787 [Gamsiella multidivaricata]|nr:hypothetical protein BGZ54_005787 [Gamsiella multidivaricata]